MLTTKVMPVRDVRQQMSRLLDEAETDGELVLITRQGATSFTDGYRRATLMAHWAASR